MLEEEEWRLRQLTFKELVTWNVTKHRSMTLGLRSFKWSKFPLHWRICDRPYFSYKLDLQWWLRGSSDVRWPQNLGPPKNPAQWTTRDRVPYAPKYLQATPWQKYVQVKFPVNCRVAQWPRGSGDVHRPQIYFGKKMATSEKPDILQ